MEFGEAALKAPWAAGRVVASSAGWVKSQSVLSRAGLCKVAAGNISGGLLASRRIPEDPALLPTLLHSNLPLLQVILCGLQYLQWGVSV